jgi:altronate dehydratase large subunit
MHPDDNVAVAAVDLPAGQAVEVAGETIRLTQPIPFGHKLARRGIARGGIVFKYGQPVGRAVAEIAAGAHVHVHNIESLRGRGDWGAAAGDLTTEGSAAQFKLKTADAGVLPATHFMGYRRKDGRAGVRNHLLVMSTVHCSNSVVDRIGQTLPDVVALSHAWGCSQLGDDLAQSRRVLEEFASHPNVGAAIIIGLGCESMPTVEMGEKLAGLGLPVARLTIQEDGGTRATYGKALGMARDILQDLQRAQRAPIPLAELIVGLECGGSDGWSGITANPAVGVASDLVVAAGGTVILSETTEFIGAEHVLAARAADDAVGRQVVAFTRGREAEAARMGVDMRGGQPTPGNIAGGLTTVEEKSLGAIAKGGSTIIQEAIPYAYRPSRRGLVVMDTPGNDPESVTAMVAGGAQIVVFTTGRGTPAGCPIAPVIKVATNSAMYRHLSDDMDLDAGTIVEAGEPLGSVGCRIFDEIVAVANGQQTAAEVWGAKEFAINVVGPRV